MQEIVPYITGKALDAHVIYFVPEEKPDGQTPLVEYDYGEKKGALQSKQQIENNLPTTRQVVVRKIIKYIHGDCLYLLLLSEGSPCNSAAFNPHSDDNLNLLIMMMITGGDDEAPLRLMKQLLRQVDSLPQTGGEDITCRHLVQ